MIFPLAIATIQIDRNWSVCLFQAYFLFDLHMLRCNHQTKRIVDRDTYKNIFWSEPLAHSKVAWKCKLRVTFEILFHYVRPL